MYDSSVLENVTAGSKLDVIAPQNGSVKREQRYDGWRSYRRDSPTVSTLFIFIYTGLRFHASPLSLSLSTFFFYSLSIYPAVYEAYKEYDTKSFHRFDPCFCRIGVMNRVKFSQRCPVVTVSVG